MQAAVLTLWRDTPVFVLGSFAKLHGIKPMELKQQSHLQQQQQPVAYEDIGFDFKQEPVPKQLSQRALSPQLDLLSGQVEGKHQQQQQHEQAGFFPSIVLQQQHQQQQSLHHLQQQQQQIIQAQMQAPNGTPLQFEQYQ